MNELILIGAYGREASKKDWEEGKDFKIKGGPYCSIRDLDAMRQEGWDIIYLCKHNGEVLEIIEL